MTFRVHCQAILLINQQIMEIDHRRYEDLQIQEVCRICLKKKDQMASIAEAGLVDKLSECASVQVNKRNNYLTVRANQ